MALDTDRDKCAHLLRRFGLGASEAELDFYAKDGIQGAIDKLLNYDQIDEGFALDIEQFRGGPKNRIGMGNVVTWWIIRMLVTRRPLQEKMTLFWHNHFATSASKVGTPMLMYAQNETLRRNSTGQFPTMLTEISKDPAMLLWLDNQQNYKGHANENYAREVMELFTLGIGHYTERDVQEAARAFTGWSLQRLGTRDEDPKVAAQFVFRERRHDDGVKQFLGSEGKFTGDDIIGLLCGQPRTPEFIAWKMWEWFVYPNPSKSIVEKMGATFRNANLDIKALLRAMMSSPEFYSAKAERAVVKCPVDFCVTTLRQLGVGEKIGEALKQAGAQAPRGQFVPARAAEVTMRDMGMWLMYPPDVAGWKIGQGWISTATMVQRIEWGDRLFGQAKGARPTMQYPAMFLFEQDPTPAGVVKKLASLYDAPLKPQRYPLLEAAAQKASGGTVTPANASATAAMVSQLIFATPEFQFG